MKLVRQLYLNFWARPRIQRSYRKLSLSETFTRIYMSKAWGEVSDQQFYSGWGSQGKAADEYCKNVVAFIRSRRIESVADLGCGDFRIGRQITSKTGVRYVGVDIVKALVERNSIQFDNGQIAFLCANLATDPLPRAQLCLVRQVLQHLSNAEIDAVLTQISQYSFALITEHTPKSPKCFNRDKPHGPDVRAAYGSGVYLEHPPFSRKVEVAWETEVDDDSVLRTVLLSGLRSNAHE